MYKKACRVVVLLMKLTHSVFDVLVAVCRCRRSFVRSLLPAEPGVKNG